MPIRDINGNVIARGGNVIEGFEWETIDFQRRILANGGNQLTGPELYAINYYVSNLKLQGLWTNLIAVYPFVGGNGGAGSMASFAVNLISNSYTLTPVNVTNAMCTANGYQGNGTSSYWNTGLAMNTIPFANISFSAYPNIVNDLQSGGFGVTIGALSNDPQGFHALAVRKTRVIFTAYEETNINYVLHPPTGDPLGFSSGSRNGNNIFVYSQNSVRSSITAANSFDYRNSRTYFIGAFNTGGGPIALSANRFTSPMIGLAFSQSQTQSLKDIQQTFETILGRQV